MLIPRKSCWMKIFSGSVRSKIHSGGQTSRTARMDSRQEPPSPAVDPCDRKVQTWKSV